MKIISTPMWAVCAAAIAASSFSATTAGAADEAKKLPAEFPNGGFEGGLDKWKGKPEGPMIQVIADAAKEGKLGLRVTDKDPAADARISSVKLPVIGGKTYRVEYDARSHGGRSVGVFIVFYNSAGDRLELESGHAYHKEVPEAATEWARYSIDGKAQADATQVEIVIRSNKVAVVTADFDNISLKQVD